MKKNETSNPAQEIDSKKENNAEGYPLYPPAEDIYNKFTEVKDIDPEDVLDSKESVQIPEPDEEEIKELGDDIMGTDLDVPGSELDDSDEEIGSEDEENNYYSIGGDRHADLEEVGEE